MLAIKSIIDHPGFSSENSYIVNFNGRALILTSAELDLFIYSGRQEAVRSKFE